MQQRRNTNHSGAKCNRRTVILFCFLISALRAPSANHATGNQELKFTTVNHKEKNNA